MMLSAALPVCVLLALSSALESPKPCTSPDLLEGQLSTFYPRALLGDYGAFSYDADNERIYTHVLMNSRGQQWQQVNLLLFRKKVNFMFYPGNGTCVKLPLHSPFPSPLLPMNATFISTINIGSTSVPHAALQVNVWFIPQDTDSYSMVTFTEHGCLPQWWAAYEGDSWFSISLYNLTLGIRDPSVFIPPPQCTDLL